jgi:MoxR-like ATPase
MPKLNQEFHNLKDFQNLASATDKKSELPADKKTEVTKPSFETPIFEDENSVTYLGVKLEKSEIRQTEFIPKREQYANYLNDEFSLELQQKIAVCLKTGDPILVEGGTSIGKTTTVRKMASELGYEVHYVNLNGSTDVEDLMGRYIANAKKKKADDPEFIFADGKVTKGLRIETGKKKIIVLDEFNSASPNILIRLHEVLDALERDGSVVLSEDASEEVATKKDNTKIIALMNPPGKGYLGREPLDPAQLRRWVYVKEANELPKSTFSKSLRFLAGLGVEKSNISPEKFLSSNDEELSLEQLSEIPGIEEIISKYEEFHELAKEAIKNRQIAEDQPQLFNYDDRVEPRRVYSFVRNFYNGDINETFQKALRYYYLNKLESVDDKEKLEEALRLVEYIPKTESKRRGLENQEDTDTSEEEDINPPGTEDPLDTSEEESFDSTEEDISPEGKMSGPILEQMKTAERIIGKENFLGLEAIKATFDFTPNTKDIPKIPFDEKTLKRAKELNQYLVLRINTTSDKKPLTMKKMNELKGGKTKDEGKILYSTDADGKLKDNAWYKNEDLYTKETPAMGWALVSKEVIPNSTNKNYLDQTEEIVNYIKNEVFKDQKVDKTYQEAIDEFDKKKDSIKELMTSDWKEASEQLASLKITQLTRQNTADVIYDILLMKEKNNKYILPGMYTWTKSRSSGGRLVDVGDADSGGSNVSCGPPVCSDGHLGVSVSRSR